MSDIESSGNGLNPEVPSDSSIRTLNANLTVDILARQINDLDSRIRRLESRDRPLTSFLRSLKRLTIITSFTIIISPILLILSVLLAYIILNPELALSETVITIFGLVGLVSLFEMVAVPIWVGAIQNKLNKIVEKHYPTEDI